VIRFGLVGVNTMHANVFAGLFNGGPDGPAVLDGGRVVAVWGDPAEARAKLVADHAIETMVDDPVAMIGRIDAVLIVDDHGGGASHAALARPFLEAGLPTFIDKPMSLDYDEAVSLFDLAERRGAPLMSCSALRYADEIIALRERAAGFGAPCSIVSVGPGDWFYYGVHAVEAYQTLVGGGAPSWVHRHALPERDVAVLGHDDGPTVVVETLRDAAYVFHLAVYGTDGWGQTEIADHAAFYRNTMAAVLAMAQTGIPGVGRDETLAVLATLAAGNRSAETGGRVMVAEVRVGRGRNDDRTIRGSVMVGNAPPVALPPAAGNG